MHGNDLSAALSLRDSQVKLPGTVLPPVFVSVGELIGFRGQRFHISLPLFLAHLLQFFLAFRSLRHCRLRQVPYDLGDLPVHRKGFRHIIFFHIFRIIFIRQPQFLSLRRLFLICRLIFALIHIYLRIVNPHNTDKGICILKSAFHLPLRISVCFAVIYPERIVLHCLKSQILRPVHICRHFRKALFVFHTHAHIDSLIGGIFFGQGDRHAIVGLPILFTFRIIPFTCRNILPFHRI